MVKAAKNARTEDAANFLDTRLKSVLISEAKYEPLNQVVAAFKLTLLHRHLVPC